MLDLHRMKYANLVEMAIEAGGAVVFYRPVGGIGDAVMICPAITETRKQWGKMLIIVICIDYIESIFQHHPDVDYIASFTPTELGKHLDRHLVKAFEDAGCIVHWLHHPCPASVYEAETAPDIIKPRQEIFAEKCDVLFGDSDYNIVLSDKERALPGLRGLGDRYIIVHLRSHDYWRDYPKLLVKSLLYKLVKWGNKHDFRIVSIDSVFDFEVKGVIPVHHAHLDAVLAVVSQTALLIGPDSSMVHIAGALGRRVLAIFGPTDANVRMKYKNIYTLGEYNRCRRQPCWYHPCKRKFCLSTLSPKRVLDKATAILTNAGLA